MKIIKVIAVALAACFMVSCADVSDTPDSNESSSSSQGNTEEGSTKRVKGNSGVSATAQKMVEQFRDNIRAIDYEIIKELEDLFMIIY